MSIVDLVKNNPKLPSPCFIVDEEKLEANVAVLDMIQQRCGVKILLALKAFAMWSVFPLLSRAGGKGPLYGICASSPDEARLGREEFGGEVHVFATGYSHEDIKKIIPLADHLLFNSFGQWARFRELAKRLKPELQCGIRINPEHSEGAVPIYDPCSPGSRLGVRLRDFKPEELEGISGLHFHTLCEQGADALERTMANFEKNFSQYLGSMKWMNFGGGHHITRPGYDLELLCGLLQDFKSRYPHLRVYLEPGEAVALNAGWLLCTVLDVIETDMPTAILDTSACAHMPDVLEMPYRPGLVGAGEPGEKPHTFRLCGKSCLAGDTIGEYSFEHPLEVGDQLLFTDMAHYTMVKTNTFNGLSLPAIVRARPSEGLAHVVKAFGYGDFKGRLS